MGLFGPKSDYKNDFAGRQVLTFFKKMTEHNEFLPVGQGSL